MRREKETESSLQDIRYKLLRRRDVFNNTDDDVFSFAHTQRYRQACAEVAYAII